MPRQPPNCYSLTQLLTHYILWAYYFSSYISSNPVYGHTFHNTTMDLKILHYNKPNEKVIHSKVVLLENIACVSENSDS